MLGVAIATSLLAVAPMPLLAKANDAPKVKINRKKARTIGYFTPAAADAHRTALFNNIGGSFADPSFRFTPSGGSSRRAVTVAIRARATDKASAERNAAIMVNGGTMGSGFGSSAYSLGASVGWKHFALSGDLARIDGGPVPENRELADVGVSYSGRRWSTRLLFGSERATGANQPNLGGPDEAVSVDLGGSYSLTGNLEVNGGLRYKSQRDRAEAAAAISDQRRDSQAIYIGTAFRF